MIGKLTGVLSGTSGDGSVVIDVQGVGYCVRTPLSYSFTPGSKISLFIHTAVRDDAIDLYGFAEEKDLAFFRQLMTVSSVGPKTALSIMGVADSLALKRAIAGGDASVLHKVFGIGKKSAERIVVELRDKMELETGSREGGAAGGEDGEVIEALMALGYSAQESRKALQHLPASAGASVKDKLGAALKHLGSRAAV